MSVEVLSPTESYPARAAKKVTEDIEVVSCTISDLFYSDIKTVPNSSVSGNITIPEYQRPYLWGSKEVEKLLDDLEDHFTNADNNTPMYYLGSIILHREEDKLNIIDGQQRITTLALMQAALQLSTPKIKYAWPISIFNIQENYKLLTSAEKKAQLTKIDLAKLNVTLIITSNEDDAYTFFETQNTGGIRLIGPDIIKAHHLREITPKGGQQDNYARTWENQHALETVIEYLIKARRWGILNWIPVPSDRDIKGTKTAIIEDFSEKTTSSKEKSAYQQIQLSDNYSKLAMQSAYFAIRQPLANGENFIDYLKVYSELYYRLFHQEDDKAIPDEYFLFDKALIKETDGTAFLKELYEIALMCYASRFGFKYILEASYWIFRYCYSRRLSNQKTVREDSIPAFIQAGNYVFDHILHSYNHQELIKKLKSFSYEFNTDNIEKNTVKSRFIQRVGKYFGFSDGWDINKDFDSELTKSIKKKAGGANV